MATNLLPLVVLDPGGLDLLRPGTGQFRYVTDLIRGLSSLRPPARFLVLGGQPHPPPELAPVFADQPDRWTYRFARRPTGRGAWLRDQAWLVAFLARVGADLYHGLHTILPVAAPCPVVNTVLDLMMERFPEYAATVRSRPYRVYRWAARHRARRLLCASATTAADVRRLWRVSASRLSVVYLGTTFSTNGSPEAQVPGVPPGAPVLVSPYNLEPRKNLAGLVTAFSAISREVSGLRLVLFGRAAVTPDRERAFEAAVLAAGVADAVVRTGILTDAALAALYARADVFVFPSLFEGFGYPVLEAMAVGACVVAREASTMAEVLGDAGTLVETADPAALTDAIRRLLRYPDQRAQLGRAAAARAQQFTVPRMAKETWRVHEEAMR